jgi:hypothetical protein
VEDHVDQSDGVLRSMLQHTLLASRLGVVACAQFLNSEHWVWVTVKQFSGRVV